MIAERSKRRDTRIETLYFSISIYDTYNSLSTNWLAALLLFITHFLFQQILEFLKQSFIVCSNSLFLMRRHFVYVRYFDKLKVRSGSKFIDQSTLISSYNERYSIKGMNNKEIIRLWKTLGENS